MKDDIYKVYDVSQANDILVASGIQLDQALELYDENPVQRILVHCSLVEGEYVCKKINVCPDSACRNRLKNDQSIAEKV